MTPWIGTSGYNYPEWRGSFYPEKFAAPKMLAYYAERFATVEINYTFYRAPTEKVLAGWRAKTPERFRFTLKAPRRITHDARLKDCAEAVTHFTRVAATLGDQLGVLLFQLPPSLRCDLALLDAFLPTLPQGARGAIEFRHASWFDAEVFARLRDRNLALCVNDSEALSAPIEITADYAYFRLRDEGYGRDDIRRWARVIEDKAGTCGDVFVYFKHEAAGKGPKFAAALGEDLGVR
jgi:uncharacterized protein YecE (DUF72 family)